MGADVIIRSAQKSDVERITEIALFTNRFNFKNILSKDFLYKKVTFELLKNEVENTFDKLEYYVLEVDEIIIGYISMSFNKDDFRECELINIAVDIAFQNKNNGKLLMDFCIASAKNMKKEIIKLEVLEKNIAAIKLYEKYGFKVSNQYFLEDLGQNVWGMMKENM